MYVNKAELFKLSGYGDKAATDEAANGFYIVCFTSVKIYTPRRSGIRWKSIGI